MKLQKSSQQIKKFYKSVKLGLGNRENDKI